MEGEIESLARSSLEQLGYEEFHNKLVDLCRVTAQQYLAVRVLPLASGIEAATVGVEASEVENDPEDRVMAEAADSTNPRGPDLAACTDAASLGSRPMAVENNLDDNINSDVVDSTRGPDVEDVRGDASVNADVLLDDGSLVHADEHDHATVDDLESPLAKVARSGD